MKKLKTAARAVAVSAMVALGVVVGTSSPALAYTPDNFSHCVLSCSSKVAGTITWYNRTAGVTGTVTDIGAGYTVAEFKAFAGSTQVGPTETRTADDENPDLGQNRGFNFTMGDTNKPGGIDSIQVQVCHNIPNTAWTCSGWFTWIRN